MSYSFEQMIRDLNNDVQWNEISRQCEEAGIKTGRLSDVQKRELSIALNEYKARMTSNKQNPNIHVEIMNFNTMEA